MDNQLSATKDIDQSFLCGTFNPSNQTPKKEDNMNSIKLQADNTCGVYKVSNFKKDYAVLSEEEFYNSLATDNEGEKLYSVIENKTNNNKIGAIVTPEMFAKIQEDHKVFS